MPDTQPKTAEPTRSVRDQKEDAEASAMQSNRLGHGASTLPAETVQADATGADLRVGLLSLAVFLVSLAYALLRYVVFGSVPIADIPLFVTNKAVSVASLLLIALAVSARRIAMQNPRLGWLGLSRRSLGMIGLYLALLHSVMSLLILNPTYFAKFYRDAQSMHLAAQLSMLAGGIALILLIAQGKTRAARDQPSSASAHSKPGTSGRAKLRWVGMSVLLFTAAHVALMGWGGWFDIASWQARMPPITLISFVIAVLGLVLGFMPKR